MDTNCRVHFSLAGVTQPGAGWKVVPRAPRRAILLFCPNITAVAPGRVTESCAAPGGEDHSSAEWRGSTWRTAPHLTLLCFTGSGALASLGAGIH